MAATVGVREPVWSRIEGGGKTEEQLSFLGLWPLFNEGLQHKVTGLCWWNWTYLTGQARAWDVYRNDSGLFAVVGTGTKLGDAEGNAAGRIKIESTQREKAKSPRPRRDSALGKLKRRVTYFE